MAKQNQLPQTLIIGQGSGGSAGKYIAGAAILITAAYFGNKYYQDKQRSDTNSKVDDDPNVNVASKIHSENRATYTEDSIQIDLFKQIQNFDEVKKAYAKLSTGKKDILEDTRPHVSSGAYQQILNIVGVNSGAVKPTSTTSQTVVTNTQPGKTIKALYLVTKVDTRIRKTPRAGSAVFTLKPNIITTAKTNTFIGAVNYQALKDNGNKLFYDSENNVFFIPIIVFDSKNAKKYYPAYVASSAVTAVNKIPANVPFLRISEFQFNITGGAAGIDGLGSIENKLI